MVAGRTTKEVTRLTVRGVCVYPSFSFNAIYKHISSMKQRDTKRAVKVCVEHDRLFVTYGHVLSVGMRGVIR